MLLPVGSSIPALRPGGMPAICSSMWSGPCFPWGSPARHRKKLLTELPFDVFVVDMGGGLEPSPVPGENVGLEQVRSGSPTPPCTGRIGRILTGRASGIWPWPMVFPAPMPGNLPAMRCSGPIMSISSCASAIILPWSMSSAERTVQPTIVSFAFPAAELVFPAICCAWISSPRCLNGRVFKFRYGLGTICAEIFSDHDEEFLTISWLKIFIPRSG